MCKFLRFTVRNDTSSWTYLTSQEFINEIYGNNQTEQHSPPSYRRAVSICDKIDIAKGLLPSYETAICTERALINN